MDARRRMAAVLLGLPLLSACELEEVTIVDPRDVVVAEAYLQLGVPADRDPSLFVPGGDDPPLDRLTVFLHRTLGPGGESLPVEGARVQVSRRRDGRTVELARAGLARCVASTPVEGTGTCYWSPPEAVVFEPGDTLELRVDLAEGGVMESLSVVPGAFQVLDGALTGPDGGGRTCTLPGGGELPVEWTASRGAWAYVTETVIHDLTEALAPRGIEVEPENDPLYLLGLAISAEDTSIVFPGEFGLFDRFDLDRDVAVALQEGLPPPARAEVTVAAVDRNYVNWVRGGNFNPSGQVRVPSVRGDGTGVFGTAVVRGFRVIAAAEGAPYDGPVCPGA